MRMKIHALAHLPVEQVAARTGPRRPDELPGETAACWRRPRKTGVELGHPLAGFQAQAQ
jgi:hypothetical protein